MGSAVCVRIVALRQRQPSGSTDGPWFLGLCSWSVLGPRSVVGPWSQDQRLGTVRGPRTTDQGRPSTKHQGLRTTRDMLDIPVLRWGQPYTSIDVDEVVHFATGEPI